MENNFNKKFYYGDKVLINQNGFRGTGVVIGIGLIQLNPSYIVKLDKEIYFVDFGKSKALLIPCSNLTKLN